MLVARCHIVNHDEIATPRTKIFAKVFRCDIPFGLVARCESNRKFSECAESGEIFCRKQVLAFLYRHETWVPYAASPQRFANYVTTRLDLQGETGFRRVWDAQFLMRALRTMGPPGLTVSTGLVGKSPVGVQIIAGRYREDLCFHAGEAIEAQETPPAPIDPRN